MKTYIFIRKKKKKLRRKWQFNEVTNVHLIHPEIIIIHPENMKNK